MKKIISKILSVCLILTVMMCSAPLSGFVGLELPKLLSIESKAVGSSLNSATVISFSRNYSNLITSESQKDFYSFTISSSGSITINLTAYLYKSEYYLYDANGKEIWCIENQYWNRNSEQFNLNEVICLTSGTYYFSVQGAKGTGSYSFKLSFNSSGESFKETIGGKNNSISSASSISCDSTYYGQIAINDTKDIYEFYAVSAGKITISVTAYIKRSSYYLYDSNGKEIWSDKYNYSSSSGSLILKQEINLSSGGYYYFCIEETIYGGDYSFSVSKVGSNTYSVYYDGNGGYVSPSSVTVMYGESTKFPTPTKTAKISYNANGGIGAIDSQQVSFYCKGWATKNYYTEPEYSCNVYYAPKSNMHLYAIWQSTTSISLSSDVPIRSGYTFLGWSTDSYATYATYKPGAYITVVDDLHLYAVWEKIPEKCTVFFDANGGISDVSNVVVMSGQKITLPTPERSRSVSYDANGGTNAPSMHYVNVECFGWSEDINSNNWYSCDLEYTVTKSVTLFALWNPMVDVKLSLNIPVKTGYEFLGWSTNRNATVCEYTEGEVITLLSDTVLYAVWEKNSTTSYTLSYNANGGSGAPSSQTGTIGYTIPSKTPIKTGYNFLGWDRYSDATSPTYYPGDYIELTKNTTLYAIWEKAESDFAGISINDVELNYNDIVMYSLELDEEYIVDFESSNTSVAEALDNGIISATGVGVAEITVTVTDEYGNVLDVETFTVTVSYAWWQWLIIIFLFGWIWY